MFIDSHCHLDRIDLAREGCSLETLLHQAHEQCVEQMLCVSIDLEQYQTMQQAISAYPQVWASAGVHPLHVDTHPFDEAKLRAAAAYPNVVALGETGLDYYYSQDHLDAQHESFAGHLRLAGELGLPVIVHTRDAREDTLKLIAEHGNLETSGVLHCFTESLDMAQAAVEMNYRISFSGIITFRNASELREVVKAIPLQHLLIETDSPYLAPVPYRGKQNQPAYVGKVAECIAELKGIGVEEVAEVTRQNFYDLFTKAQPR
ncbi:TatD family hydrolase [Nitrincola tapanii]|uniref:TatD family deoxyribonuclease n=1 Tax=Nitrincola tapanii TaxID=1708751 RepID=A0A5A9W7L7_9GAMM|nr:TatD family hydrolase [Nitrincola tapanii]KAA0875451.1 TatD family deoxyribonuclease [Nitrincola tapanii]